MTNSKQFEPALELLDEPPREHSREEVNILLTGARQAWKELGEDKRSILGGFLSRLQSELNLGLINHPEILDHIHDAVISTTPEGIITDCNSAAERIYGYSRAELLGNSVAILYPEDQLPRMRDLISNVHANGKADGEFLNHTKNGRKIWIHLSVSLLKSKRDVPCGMIGFSIDITQQIEAKRQRQQDEEMNRAARAAAGVGIWSWDLRTQALYWDEQSRLMLDIPQK